jgi:iron(III) transport system ATP-binding protein
VSEVILGLEGVGHSYDGATEVVSGFSLGVGAGEIVCLLGPSGCGKSTVLRLAAGLEQLQRGRIKLRGEVVAEGESGVSEPPERRNVGLVFQDFALFPHLTVARNVAFGLSNLSEDRRSQRALEALSQVGMASYAGAYPHALSGGQQQRVALARALAPRPSVMLLDEPFSGLDARLREQIRDDTLRVLKRSGAATLLVTHDPEEAMFMADRIYLMQAGRLIQSGPPAEVYARPNSEFAAKFFSNINELGGVVEAGTVATPLGPIAASGWPAGTRVNVLFRPESLHCAPLNGAPQGGGVELLATVTEVRFIGVARLLRVRATAGDGAALDLQVRATGSYAPEVGAKVGLTLDPAQAFVFGPEPSAGQVPASGLAEPRPKA